MTAISAAEAEAAIVEIVVGDKIQFCCNLCDKKFNYKNGLKRHVRLTHIGEKPFECNICNRSFGYKHILLEHQNLHFGNKPYACNLCDKRFAARSNLVQHRVVHKKPLSCYLCGKRFDKEEQLKKHLFAHPQTFLSCNFCQFMAANQGELNSHLIEKHPPQFYNTREKKKQNEDLSMSTPPQSTDETPESPNVTVSMTTEVAMTTDVITTPTSYNSPGSASHKIEEICKQLQANANNPPIEDVASNVIIKKEVETELGRNCTRGETQDEDARQNGGSTPQVDSPNRAPEDLSLHNVHSSTTSYSSLQAVSSATTTAASITMEKSSLGLPSIETILQRPPNIYSRNSNLLIDTHLPTKDPRFTLPPLSSLSSAYMMPGATDPHRSPANFSGLMPFSQFSHTLLRMPTTESTHHNIAATDLTNISPNSLGSPGVQRSKEVPVSPTNTNSAYPELEDILNYYVNQGRLFRCEHCHILFFERSMYFLHSSLHGTTNPWECGICHKVCGDKNEFTIHFVNQQHTNQH